MGLVRTVALKGWAARLGGALAAAALAVAAAPAAQAEQPVDWQMTFQQAASPVRVAIDSLNDELLVIITLITLFVLGLLLYVIIRFSAKRHPTASQTTHNTLIELLWTTVPILILVVIAIPSFKLLFYVDRAQNPAMTIKVTGHQWYWTYEYPDQGDISFDSYMIPEDQLKPGQKRLLDVDSPVVLPVGSTIRILVGSTDVIHSWFMPAFGVQEYAVIGRTNESWVKIDREGTFYGQCNQICGVNHPFMPIEVKAVSTAKFGAWAACAKAAQDDKARAACYAPLEADEAPKAKSEKIAAKGGGAVTVAANAAR